jgi:uncharacterized membrane protein YedE/YeeE
MGDMSFAAALCGGALIGLASALLLSFNGRIAGISGITGGLMDPGRGDRAWRASFLAGLIGGGAAMAALRPAAFPGAFHRSIPLLVVAGLLVGVGTRVSSGCTSGHGVCGMSRLSPRSMAATATFIATAMATLWIARATGVTP